MPKHLCSFLAYQHLAQKVLPPLQNINTNGASFLCSFLAYQNLCLTVLSPFQIINSKGPNHLCSFLAYQNFFLTVLPPLHNVTTNGPNHLCSFLVYQNYEISCRQCLDKIRVVNIIGCHPWLVRRGGYDPSYTGAAFGNGPRQTIPT